MSLKLNVTCIVTLIHLAFVEHVAFPLERGDKRKLSSKLKCLQKPVGMKCPCIHGSTARALA